MEFLVDKFVDVIGRRFFVWLKRLVGCEDEHLATDRVGVEPGHDQCLAGKRRSQMSVGVDCGRGVVARLKEGQMRDVARGAV